MADVNVQNLMYPQPHNELEARFSLHYYICAGGLNHEDRDMP